MVYWHQTDLCCVGQGFDSSECMRMVDQDQADLVVLDPGLTFIAGRFHSLVPIMQEVYNGKSVRVSVLSIVTRGVALGSISSSQHPSEFWGVVKFYFLLP